MCRSRPHLTAPHKMARDPNHIPGGKAKTYVNKQRTGRPWGRKNDWSFQAGTRETMGHLSAGLMDVPLDIYSSRPLDRLTYRPANFSSFNIRLTVSN